VAGKKLNPAAFAIPNTLGQGNESRNSIPAFPLRQIDLSAYRKFNFGDRLSANLRIDAFNVINHPNFGPPSTYLGYCNIGTPSCATTNLQFGTTQAMENRSLTGSGSAGQGFSPIYQIGGPRSLQASLKILF